MGDEKKGKQLLRFFLGLFWLVDGILQLQPKMFTPAFSTNILKVNLPAQPHIIAKSIAFGMHIFSWNMGIANASFALVQLLIGAALLLPIGTKWKRRALWVSLLWCCIVWLFGEGLGNLLTGSASFYTGAPGSVMLYFILALSLLLPDVLPYQYLPQTAGVLFYAGGILNEVPMFWTKGMQVMTFQMSLLDRNAFIAAPAKYLSTIATSTFFSNLFAIGILVILGILLMLKPIKWLGWITAVFLFGVWWVAQDFGGIFTFPFGTATDPNSAPLFLLFLLPLFLREKTKKKQTKENKTEFLTVPQRIDFGKWVIAGMLVLLAVVAGFALSTVNQTVTAV